MIHLRLAPVRILRRLARHRVALIGGVVALVGVELLAAAWSPVRIAEAGQAGQGMDGLAVFPGAVIGDTRYGVTFTGMTEGTVQGWYTVTANYSPGSAAGGMTNTFKGGKWQVTLVERGLYQGTIYGDIVGGQIVRDPTGIYADVGVDFIITGGTGTYAGATGRAHLQDGKADHTPFPPTLNGRLVLDLDPPQP